MKHPKNNIYAWIFFCVICLLLGGFTSVYLGQDANWDLKNYHLYNAWSFLHNRLSKDVFAAGIQSYFSPYLDIPYYLLSTKWFPESPRLVAFIMGLPFGVLMFTVYMIGWILVEEYKINPIFKVIIISLATGFGVTGVATVSQIGTTFNEIQTATVMLGGLLLIIIAIQNFNIGSIRRANLYLLGSGILFGVAAGLKLTAITYAPGAAAVIVAISGTMQNKFSRLLIFSSAWGIAFLTIWGSWGLALYKLTGSPFFPLFNSIFQSPWIAPSGGLDTRFMPNNLLEAVFYPFYWVDNLAMTVMEPKFSDPRFAIVFVLFLILLTSFIFQLKDSRSQQKNNYIFTATDGAILFFIVSYILWESLFSILRYAVVLESILGLISVILITKISLIVCYRKTYIIVVAALVSMLFFAITITIYPDWGRTQFSHNVFEIKVPKLPDNSLILLVGKPIAYVAPFLKKNEINFELIGITNTVISSREYELSKIIQDKINGWDGPIFYLARPESLSSAKLLSDHLLYPHGACEIILSNIDEPVYLCPVTRTKNALEWQTASNDRYYRLGNKISFKKYGESQLYVNNGWSSPESWGTWTNADKASVILILLNIPQDDLSLKFKSHAFLVSGKKQLKVVVFVNGVTLETFAYNYPQDTDDRVRKVKVPADLVVNSGGIIKVDFVMFTPVSPASVGLSDDSRKLGLGMAWIKLETQAM